MEKVGNLATRLDTIWLNADNLLVTSSRVFQVNSVLHKLNVLVSVSQRCQSFRQTRRIYYKSLVIINNVIKPWSSIFLLLFSICFLECHSFIVWIPSVHCLYKPQLCVLAIDDKVNLNLLDLSCWWLDLASPLTPYAHHNRNGRFPNTLDHVLQFIKFQNHLCLNIIHVVLVSKAKKSVMYVLFIKLFYASPQLVLEFIEREKALRPRLVSIAWLQICTLTQANVYYRKFSNRWMNYLHTHPFY